MWSIALLINTSTWFEFKRNWKLIYIIFLQLHLGNGHSNRKTMMLYLIKLKMSSLTRTPLKQLKEVNLGAIMIELLYIVIHMRLMMKNQKSLTMILWYEARRFQVQQNKR